MLIYYVGVIKTLMSLGVLGAPPAPAAGPAGAGPRAAVPRPAIAGASAGALAAGAICAGVSPDALHQSVTSFIGECAAAPCVGRIDALLRETVTGLLPRTAPQTCDGAAFMSVSVLVNRTLDGGGAPEGPGSGRPRGLLRNELVSNFSSYDDLVSTLLASSFIPGWSNRSATTAWRGRRAADGGFTDVQPLPPATPRGGAIGYTVRIANVEPPPPAPPKADGEGGAEGAEESGVGGGVQLRRLVQEILRIASGARPAADALAKPALPARVPPPRARLEAMRARGVDIAPGLSIDISPLNRTVISEVRGSWRRTLFGLPIA